MRKKLQTYCLYIRSPGEIKFSGRKKEEKQETWKNRATLDCVRLARGKRENSCTNYVAIILDSLGKTIIARRVIIKTVSGENERITDITLISPDFHASKGFAKEQ